MACSRFPEHWEFYCSSHLDKGKSYGATAQKLKDLLQNQKDDVKGEEAGEKHSSDVAQKNEFIEAAEESGRTTEKRSAKTMANQNGSAAHSFLITEVNM